MSDRQEGTLRMAPERRGTAGHVQVPARGVASESQSLAWLRSRGVPSTDFALVRDIAQARNAAADFGYPLAMKITGVVHKSEFDGVVAGIADEGEMEQAFARLSGTMRRIHASDVHEVMIQPQHAGVEFFVGVRRDSGLGPAVAVGAGGVLVELLADVAVDLAPLTPRDAGQMVERLRGKALLDGHRGAPRLDRGALERLLVLVGDIAVREPSIQELDLNPVMVSADGVVAVDARIVFDPTSEPVEAGGEPVERDTEPVERGTESAYRGPRALPAALFEPGSVAVVGASNDPNKPGGRALAYLRHHGFEGRIYPVNPNSDQVGGIPAVPSVRDIPNGPPDLACVAVPPDQVIEAVADCADRNVPAAIVFTADFGESGPQGKAREDALRGLLRTHPTPPRVAGPNTIGIVSPGSKTVTAFAQSLQVDAIPTGGLAFVSQSGALGSALLSRLWQRGIGISRYVSTGNEVDIGVGDYLDFLADDDRTEVIAVFLETVRDSQTFARAARRCREAGRPVLAVKVGRSAVAQRAIASHTGALAGADDIYDAFLRRHGVLRLRSLQQLLDVAVTLLTSPRPAGRRLAVLTMSGGASSLIADESERCGLEIPALNEDTQTRLRQRIPPYGAVANPVDATVDAAARPDIVAGALEILDEAPGIDLMLVQLTTNADPSATAIARAILDVRRRSAKPILVGRLGAENLAPQAMGLYREHGVPVFDLPERLVDTAAGVCRYAELLEETTMRDHAYDRVDASGGA